VTPIVRRDDIVVGAFTLACFAAGVAVGFIVTLLVFY